MSKKGPPQIPPPEYKIQERYGHRQVDLLNNAVLAKLYREAREREEREKERRRQEARRNWQIFWWSCAMAACAMYWVWWLWPVAEPVTWTWRG